MSTPRNHLLRSQSSLRSRFRGDPAPFLRCIVKLPQGVGPA